MSENGRRCTGRWIGELLIISNELRIMNDES